MKVLVTGGSGYLGTHVRRYFTADDLSRRSGLDIRNLQDAQMAADYDLVIHMAACLDKSPEAAEEVFLTNVEGTLNLLRVMRKDSAFVFASTKDVYGRFADKYPVVSESCETLYSGQSALEWSKLIAERYVDYYSAQRGFRACTLRMSTVYAPNSPGNRPNFVGHYANAIKRGEPFSLPGRGSPRRDLMHVDDLAGACEAFSDSAIRRGLYNIGGGPRNALSLKDLVSTMESVSGLQAVIDDAANLPDPVPFDYVSDISRIIQELGWKPGIGVETGLRTLFTGGETE